MASPVNEHCRICGSYGKLSFEHVPPKKAFNDDSVLLADVEKLRTGCHPDLYEQGGRRQQRGVGGYTLCKDCNNKTGDWYAREYVKLARQGMGYLQAARLSTGSFYVPFRLKPLHVIKQVMCMFMSANGPKFQSVQTELVRFILNRETKHLPEHLRLFGFYSIGERSRSAGVSGLIEGFGGASPSNYILSEITFPPFGFVLTFNSPAPDKRLADISYLADDYAWNQERTIWLRLPVLPIYTFYPGDYRDRDKVLKDAEQNLSVKSPDQ